MSLEKNWLSENSLSFEKFFHLWNEWNVFQIACKLMLDKNT
jgi:hypothetical protein